MLRIFITYAVLAFTTPAFALLLDINSNVSLGNLTTSSAQTSNKMVNAFGVFANLSRKEASSRLQIGWYILSFSSKDYIPSVVNQTLDSSDMGPAVRWDIDKRGFYSLTFAYGVICKGSLYDGSTTSSLSGVSYLVKASIEPQITDRLYIGGAINYYSATYDTSVVGSTQSTISYQNNLIYPSISLAYRY